MTFTTIAIYFTKEILIDVIIKNQIEFNVITYYLLPIHFFSCFFVITS